MAKEPQHMVCPIETRQRQITAVGPQRQRSAQDSGGRLINLFQKTTITTEGKPRSLKPQTVEPLDFSVIDRGK